MATRRRVPRRTFAVWSGPLTTRRRRLTATGIRGGTTAYTRHLPPAQPVSYKYLTLPLANIVIIQKSARMSSSLSSSASSDPVTSEVVLSSEIFDSYALKSAKRTPIIFFLSRLLSFSTLLLSNLPASMTTSPIFSFSVVRFTICL